MKGKFARLLDIIRVTNRASNNEEEEEEDEKTTTIAIIMVQQRAFVFIKPHACVRKRSEFCGKQDLVEVLNRNDVDCGLGRENIVIGHREE